MSYGNSSISRLPGVISSYFVLETKVASTRTADAFKALDKFKRQSIGVWVTRAALNQTQISQFGSRVATLAAVGAAADVLSYGVDASGIAFMVFPVFDGKRVNQGVKDLVELERRFLTCLRAIEKLHNAGVTCGDICLDSFVVDRAGQVRFIGLLGSFEAPQSDTASLPPPESLDFVAPEQGSNLTPAADVYALAVLGYLLYTGEMPAPTDPALVTSLNPQAPVWLDAVIQRALSSNPNARPQDATAFLFAIASAKSDESAKQNAPAIIDPRASSRALEKVQEFSVMNRTSSSVGLPDGHASEEESKKKSPEPLKLGVLGTLCLIGLLAVAGWIGFTILRKPPELKDAGPIEVNPVDVPSAAIDKKSNPTAFIQQLMSSDDPIAHDSLIRLFKEAGTPEVRDSAAKGLIDRSRRLGLLRSSDQVRSWLKLQSDGIDQATAEQLFRIIDPAIPLPSRLDLLSRLNSRAPALALKVVVALILDQPDIPDYNEPLAVMVASLPNAPDAKGHSALATILLVPETSSLFLDDIMTAAGKIPDADIIWLLEQLAARGSPHLQTAADLASTRKLITGPKQRYLDILRRKSNVPPTIASSLVAAATRGPTKVEIATFGTWYDQDAEKVLLASIVVSSDPAVVAAASEALAAKAISDPYIASLFDLIQTTDGPNKATLAKLLGVVALEGDVSDAQFNEAFGDFGSSPKARELVVSLLKSPSSRVVRETIDRYSALLDITTLLDLLQHSDKNVRIVAVKSLHKANDIAALKLLLDGYQKENDPDVRTAYETYIAVVKERKGKEING